jgi:hypothetical protein
MKHRIMKNVVHGKAAILQRDQNIVDKERTE